jgi:hypothetical protein
VFGNVADVFCHPLKGNSNEVARMFGCGFVDAVGCWSLFSGERAALRERRLSVGRTCCSEFSSDCWPGLL